MLSVDQLREAALQLPVLERETLVHDLLLSIDSLDTEETMDAELMQELERRSDAYHNGEVAARDWRESMADIRLRVEGSERP